MIKDIGTEVLINELGNRGFLVRKKVKDSDESKFSFITKAICHEFNIDESVIFSKRRHLEINNARQIIHYFLRFFTKYSTTKIGKLTNRDHATVIHSCKAVNAHCETEPAFKAKIEKLKKQIVFSGFREEELYLKRIAIPKGDRIEAYIEHSKKVYGKTPDIGEIATVLNINVEEIANAEIT